MRLNVKSTDGHLCVQVCYISQNVRLLPKLRRKKRLTNEKSGIGMS